MRSKGIYYSTIQMIVVLYLVVWSISPFMEIDLIYRLLAVVAAGVWCVLLALRQKPIVFDYKQSVALFFMVAVVTVTYMETGKVSGIIKQIGYFMLVICFLICVFYKNQWRELRIIVPIALILLLIFNFKTGNALLLDPTIARKLVRNDESIYPYLRQGIGGYSLIYSQVCIFPAILQWVVRAYNKNKWYFALGLVYLTSYLFVIYNAGYSIAIFTTIAGVILLFFYKGNSAIKAFLVCLILFGALMAAILYLEGFRNWLLQTFDGTAICHKIEDLVATSETGAAEGSIQSRMTRYLASIKLMYRYPVIGSLWKESGGGHSAVLDTFGKYGIWGGIIFCGMIYYVPINYKKDLYHTLTKRTANATHISILIVSVLDSFPYAFMAVILLLLPLLLEDIQCWIGENNENSVDG